MNDITPEDAIEILSHYTVLGYGIVIEGEDTSKIKQALSFASKTLAVEHSLSPLSGEADNAYMRGYEVGKAEGILKAESRPTGELKKLYGDKYYCSKCGKDCEQLYKRFCGYCGAELQ